MFLPCPYGPSFFHNSVGAKNDEHAVGNNPGSLSDEKTKFDVNLVVLSIVIAEVKVCYFGLSDDVTQYVLAYIGNMLIVKLNLESKFEFILPSVERF